jgi:hypothetical protein
MEIGACQTKKLVQIDSQEERNRESERIGKF